MRRVALLVSLIMLFTSTIQTTYGFIVVATDPVVNTFRPDQVQQGGLTIAKRVEHISGEGYLVPADAVFTFDLNLGQEYHDSAVALSGGNNPASITADENGIVKGIQLKAGESVFKFHFVKIVKFGNID